MYDPNPLAHSTIRLSNPVLRQQNIWYTLHWRPSGGSTVLLRPETQKKKNKKKERRKAKKQRRRERDRKDRDGVGGGGSGLLIA